METSRPKKTILVCDDERVTTDLLRDILEGTGYRVIVARDGEESLNKARAERPDLIVLDVMMPKLDGFKVARLLKSDKRYQRIPILILTARAGDEDRSLAENCGADYFVQKPFDPDHLVERIAAFLGD